LTVAVLINNNSTYSVAGVLGISKSSVKYKFNAGLFGTTVNADFTSRFKTKIVQIFINLDRGD